MHMLQVIYSSAATVPFSELELTLLLRGARANNTKLGVTGMLLFQDGSFLQVVEGDEPVVEALLQKIGRDERHSGVNTLLRREVEARHFGDWAMGFVSPKYLTKALPGYSDYLRLRGGDPEKSANAAERVLAGFRDGRFRSYVAAR
jgi:Sensors of blue-light using FAD